MAKNKIKCIICTNHFSINDYSSCPHCGYEPNMMKVKNVMAGDEKLVLSDDFVEKKRKIED
jgi:rRNA maturation endonuclease Nob1